MSLTLFINGRKRVFSQGELDPKMTLLQFLRKSGLTGAKLGCGEGGCGACTVMLSSYDVDNKKPIHYSANACLTPVCALDGIAITTVEGIGSMKEGLHPVQQRISAMHGSQCGYCTPGIVMAIYTFLRENPNATPHEIESSLDGNLCRCTGYRPILDAARSLSNNKEVPPPPAGCCKGSGGKCPCAEGLKQEDTPAESFLHNTSEDSILAGASVREALTAVSRSEPIFPSELTHYEFKTLEMVGNGSKWFQPVTLDHLLAIKTEYPSAKLIVGNTEVGIEMRLKAMEYNVFVNPSRVPELRVLESTETGIVVGAAVTINGLRAFSGKMEAEKEAINKPYLTRGLKAIKHMLTWFASNHIRNVACIGGNIATASPISDLNPMLLASNAILKIHSKSRGSRDLPIKEFFLAYRKVALDPDEILVSVFIPYTSEFEYVLPFKQARRREDDVSIVTAGMRVRLAPKPATASTEAGWVVEDCTLSFGGMAPTAIQANATSQQLIGQDWNYASVESVFATMRKELALPVSVPGGQAEYRMALAVSFLYKCYLTMTAEHGAFITKLGQHAYPAVPSINPSDLSATFNFLTEEKTYSRGEQGHFDRQGAYIHTAHTPDSAPSFPPAKEATVPGGVGASLMHKNAAAQVTGATKYVDDMPLPSNAVHACLVTSTKAHARVLSVDTSAAEKCAGYVTYICAKDVIGSNKMGVIVKDEEIFVTDVASYHGAVIGAVIADSHEEAVLAARKVVVEYEELTPVVSINDAIAANSFLPTHHSIVSGDLDSEKANADIVVEGTGRMGGQEHFYLETNATIALPSENGHMEVFSSTQNIAETQHYCACVCGVPASKIVAKVKRMGGGFGGKESRSAMFACVAALAATVLDRAVSINIERDVDMSLSGQRHAFQYNYKAGMKKDGSLKFLEVDVFSNGGYSHDLSVPVMDRALFHIDNVYRWPALTARGNVCRTNQPTHTAFRGFGGPQGMVITETVMQHLAESSGLQLDFLKAHNMYHDGDRTHFGQKLEHFFVPSLWEKAHAIADVEERKAKIVEFNKLNRWRKRGMAVTPTKFGINFTAKFMNQGGALVHVYTDGSVLVAHGGTEMGQGLFTKVIQVAAQSFGISEQYIITTESATNTVPNASPSAASLSTDLYGMAVLDACEIIKKRLEPIKARLGDCDWPTLVRTAFFDRIDLSAHGFYKIHTDRCGYDFDKECNDNSERGFPFNYFTMGVAVTEVEIDCLTGDSNVLRADILMDVGKSINPAIDIGQIEGAYVQGFGWSTMEDLIWGDKEHPWVRPGQLFTRGPGTYKIPSFNDVPADFRVHLSDTDNRFAVHSSKAVGEPPFFMGASAFFAIKDAIIAARRESGYSEYYQLNLPATSERIRMACTDDIAKLCVSAPAAKNGVENFQPLASC